MLHLYTPRERAHARAHTACTHTGHTACTHTGDIVTPGEWAKGSLGRQPVAPPGASTSPGARRAAAWRQQHAPNNMPSMHLHAPCMHPACTLHAPACTLHAPCMHPACTLHAPNNMPSPQHASNTSPTHARTQMCRMQVCRTPGCGPPAGSTTSTAAGVHNPAGVHYQGVHSLNRISRRGARVLHYTPSSHAVWACNTPRPPINPARPLSCQALSRPAAPVPPRALHCLERPRKRTHSVAAWAFLSSLTAAGGMQPAPLKRRSVVMGGG
jgi:hypothetical protein